MEEIFKVYQKQSQRIIQACVPLEGLRGSFYRDWFRNPNPELSDYYLLEFQGAEDITEIMSSNTAYGGDKDGNTIDRDTAYKLYKFFINKAYIKHHVSGPEELIDYYKG